MDFNQASERYRELSAMRAQNKLDEVRFAEEVAALQVQDSEGHWWQVNYADGSWLRWSGTSWVEDIPPGLNVFPMPQPAEGPQTLVQLFVFLVKSFKKNMPKMLIQSAVIAVLIWLAHAYILIVLNNGYLKVGTAVPWSADTLALRLSNFNNVAMATTLWTVVGWLLSFIFFNRIIGRGPINYAKDIFFTPLWISNGFKNVRSGTPGYLIFLSAIVLVLNSLLDNTPLALIVGIALVVALTARFEGLSYMFINLGYSDFQRLFRKDRQPKQFNEGYLIALFLSVALAMLLYVVLPFKPYSAYLAAGLFVGVGFFLIFRPKTSAITIVFTLYYSFIIYLFLTEGASAHDVGFEENGRDWGRVLASEARNEALGVGNIPAAGGFLGALLGTLSSAASSVANTASSAAGRVTDAVSGAYQSAKENIAYGAEIVGGTFINIAIDMGETYETVSSAASSAWEGTKQMASDTYDAARDVYNNPHILGETIAHTMRDVGGYIVEGAKATADAASDVWNDPSIISETLGQTMSDVYDIGADVGNAVYTTVTDPKKAWEVAKEVTGINDLLIHALDPNKSLLERIGHVGKGTLKVGATIMTVGKIGAAASKAGAAIKTKAAGLFGKSSAVATKATAGKSAAVAAKLPVARPGDAKNLAAWKKAQRQGAQKVNEFAKALKSGDSQKIQKAAVRLQSDNQAITNLNNRKINDLTGAFNKEMQRVYDATDRRVINELARKHKVPASQIKRIAATNRPIPGKPLKGGFDRDVTYRIGNRDLPSSEVQKVYNREFARTTGGFDAKRAGQTMVNRLDAEAYGRSSSDLRRAIHGRTHIIKDSQQMGKTMSFKGHEAFREAAHTISNPGQSQRHMYDGIRQVSKQWNRQITETVNHFTNNPGKLGPPRVPERLQEAMKIMDKINHGASPVEITQQLRGLGLTPGDVATQAGEFFDSMIRLAK